MERYQITYASRGRLPDMSGDFHMFVDANLGPVPTIVDAEGKANLLDPRCVIRDACGHTVYTPRDYPLDMFTRSMRGWLIDHPDWGTR